MGRPCANPVAIYLMRLSGYLYVGKHEHPDAAGWPTRGRGALPSGYSGSGFVWRRVVRKHGRDGIRWSLLRVIPPGGDWEGAEREEIARVREKYPDRYTNVYDGGDGFTGDDMRKLWSDPEHREMMRGVGRRVGAESWRDPERRRKIVAGLVRARTDPECIARARQSMSEAGLRKWEDNAYRAARLPHLQASQGVGSRRGADERKLEGAVARRDAGRCPLPWDNAVLASAGERPNPLPVAGPTEPVRSGKVAAALRALREGPKSAAALGAAIGLPEPDARCKVDQLVRLGWPVQNEGGVYRLIG